MSCLVECVPRCAQHSHRRSALACIASLGAGAMKPIISCELFAEAHHCLILSRSCVVATRPTEDPQWPRQTARSGREPRDQALDRWLSSTRTELLGRWPMGGGGHLDHLGHLRWRPIREEVQRLPPDLHAKMVKMVTFSPPGYLRDGWACIRLA
jgi:hypothetical protein